MQYYTFLKAEHFKPMSKNTFYQAQEISYYPSLTRGFIIIQVCIYNAVL